MPYAPNLTESLFKAIEEQYGTGADMNQLAGSIHWGFVPPPPQGEEEQFPRVVVTQGEEGGSTDHAASSAGIESADESFAITFEAYADTMAVASQIGWQLSSLFTGWTGDYEGVHIGSCYRNSPPWTGQVEQGVCMSSVSFMVSCSVREEE